MIIANAKFESKATEFEGVEYDVFQSETAEAASFNVIWVRLRRRTL